MQGSNLACVCLLLLGTAGLACAQLSSIAKDSDVDASSNKFLQRQANRDQPRINAQPGCAACSAASKCSLPHHRSIGQPVTVPLGCVCREIMDEVVDPRTCPQNIALKWHTEIGSSVYATPLITDLFSDGRKDIIVPGFVHNLEVRRCRWWVGGGLPGAVGGTSPCCFLQTQLTHCVMR